MRFEEKDLFPLVNNPKSLALFNLSEKQKHVIRMRIVEHSKFKDIASEMKITIPRAHQLYERCLEKMTKRILEILEEYSQGKDIDEASEEN